MNIYLPNLAILRILLSDFRSSEFHSTSTSWQILGGVNHFGRNEVVFITEAMVLQGGPINPTHVKRDTDIAMFYTQLYLPLYTSQIGDGDVKKINPH